MLFASGLLALLCAGLAADSLLVGTDESDADSGDGNGGSGQGDDTEAPPPGEALDPADPTAAADGTTRSALHILLEEAEAGTEASEPAAAPAPLAPEADPEGDTETLVLPASHDEEIDGYGAVAVVEDFLPGIDRLILDFDPDLGPAPEITLNTAIEDGSTGVMADGVLVVMLRDVTGVATEDIALEPVSQPQSDPVLDGGTAQDATQIRTEMAPQLAPATEAWTGGAGTDIHEGGSGNDALFGNGGSDFLTGGDGNDEISGDAGHDVIAGGTGADYLTGGTGEDSLYGGTGDDALFGGAEADRLAGDGGNDILQGGFGADTIDGGAGDDRIDGTYSTQNIFAIDEDEGDILRGGAGNDAILAGSGDLVEGGAGADRVTTGLHVDATDVPVFEDFNPNEDIIEVLYDPLDTPDPVVTLRDFADGSGADVLFNGVPVLSVIGAQGLDPALVELKAVAPA